MLQPWQRINGIETLMLQNANPHNPVIITAIFSLSKPPTHAWLHDIVLPRLLRHPRFSARVVSTPGRPLYFDPLPDFAASPDAVAAHVLTEPLIDPSLPFAARHAAFTSRVSAIVSEHLPLDAPLWRVHIFPAFSVARPDPPRHTDCATVVFRVHHSIADGIGLMKFFLSEMLDGDTAHKLPLARNIAAVPHRQTNRLATADAAAAKPPSAQQEQDIPPEIDSDKNGEGDDGDVDAKPQPPPLPTPPIPPYRPSGIARRAHNIVRDLYRTSFGLLVPDTTSALTRGELTGEKVCAVIPPSEFPLDMLKMASRRLGVTLNDILYASLSGALGEYLRENDSANANESGTKGSRSGSSSSRRIGTLRLAVPFNKHMLDDYAPRDVRNNFAVLALPLHADAEEPLERLERCARTTRDAKEGVQPTAAVLLLRGLSALLPRAVARPLWNRLTRAVSLVFTNMPGPRTRVGIGDIECEGMHFFAPADGEQGVVVGLLSYDGQVCVALAADKSRIAEPEAVLERMRRHVHAYVDMSKTVGAAAETAPSAQSSVDRGGGESAGDAGQR